MPAPLAVAVARPGCVPLGIAANAAAHAKAVSRSASPVVFPELSLTGYGLAAPAVSPADPRLRPLVTARHEGATALVGAPVRAAAGRRACGRCGVRDRGHGPGRS